jgi:hypothetical protein
MSLANGCGKPIQVWEIDDASQLGDFTDGRLESRATCFRQFSARVCLRRLVRLGFQRIHLAGIERSGRHGRNGTLLWIRWRNTPGRFWMVDRPHSRRCSPSGNEWRKKLAGTAPNFELAWISQHPVADFVRIPPNLPPICIEPKNSVVDTTAAVVGTASYGSRSFGRRGDFARSTKRSVTHSQLLASSNRQPISRQHAARNASIRGSTPANTTSTNPARW